MAPRRNKEKVAAENRDRLQRLAATKAAKRELKAARNVRDIEQLIADADAVALDDAPKLQAALQTLDFDGKWATLVRDFAILSPSLQKAVAELCACHARVRRRLLVAVAAAVHKEKAQGDAELKSAAGKLLMVVLGDFRKLEGFGRLRGAAAGGAIDLDPENTSAEAAIARLEIMLARREGRAPVGPAAAAALAAAAAADAAAAAAAAPPAAAEPAFEGEQAEDEAQEEQAVQLGEVTYWEACGTPDGPVAHALLDALALAVQLEEADAPAPPRQPASAAPPAPPQQPEEDISEMEALRNRNVARNQALLEALGIKGGSLLDDGDAPGIWARRHEAFESTLEVAAELRDEWTPPTADGLGWHPAMLKRVLRINAQRLPQRGKRRCTDKINFLQLLEVFESAVPSTRVGLELRERMRPLLPILADKGKLRAEGEKRGDALPSCVASALALHMDVGTQRERSGVSVGVMDVGRKSLFW